MQTKCNKIFCLECTVLKIIRTCLILHGGDCLGAPGHCLGAPWNVPIQIDIFLIETIAAPLQERSSRPVVEFDGLRKVLTQNVLGVRAKLCKFSILKVWYSFCKWSNNLLLSFNLKADCLQRGYLYQSLWVIFPSEMSVIFENTTVSEDLQQRNSWFPLQQSKLTQYERAQNKWWNRNRYFLSSRKHEHRISCNKQGTFSQVVLWCVFWKLDDWNECILPKTNDVSTIPLSIKLSHQW